MSDTMISISALVGLNVLITILNRISESRNPILLKTAPIFNLTNYT